MMARNRRRPGFFERAALGSVARALAVAAALTAAGCGGNDCAGVLTTNVDAAQCESLAKQFGCERFDVEGPRCGLFGCASCGELNPMSQDQ
jgi:hypothetical protein